METLLAGLTSTSTDFVLDGEGEETLWSRIKTLAQGFVDGVLSVAGLRAENIYVENELCVDGVCVTADDLRALLQEANRPSGGSGSGESIPPPAQEEVPAPEDDNKEEQVEVEMQTQPNGKEEEEQSEQSEQSEPTIIPAEEEPEETDEALPGEQSVSVEEKTVVVEPEVELFEAREEGDA